MQRLKSADELGERRRRELLNLMPLVDLSNVSKLVWAAQLGLGVAGRGSR